MNRQAQLLLDHFDIWIDATLPTRSAGRSNAAKVSLYGVDKLRALVLDLAVRGKLVPQDARDEDSAELLRRIKSERGFSDASPSLDASSSALWWDLPRSWSWTSLDVVCDYIQRGKGPIYDDDGSVFVVSQKCIQWSGFDLGASRRVSDATLEGYSSERILRSGDLLWNSTGTGTVGRANVLDCDISETMVVDSHVTVVRTTSIDPHYILIFVSSPAVQARMDPAHFSPLVSGTTNQVELNTSSIRKLPFPLPPLSEQRRIASKVRELMGVVDLLSAETHDGILAHGELVRELFSSLTAIQDANSLRSCWGQIAAHFDDLMVTEDSVDALRKTIFDLAVRGALSNRDTSDGTATELLKSVRESVERGSVSSRTIKTSDGVRGNFDQPWPLPSGWCWAELADLGVTSTGGTPKSSNAEAFGGDVPFIGPGQLAPDGRIIEGEKKLSEAGVAESAQALPGDILMVCIGGSIGKSAVVRSRTAFNQQINCLSPRLVDTDYVSIVFRSQHFQREVIRKSSGSATPIINRSKWNSIIVPVPPLAEMRRISAVVRELLLVCDRLTAGIRDVSSCKVEIADAVCNWNAT